MNRFLVGFVGARTVSIFGDRVADIALPIVILTASGSAGKAGLVGAAGQLPQVLAALHLGALVDRRDRRGLMIGADLLRAGAFVGIALELACGGDRLAPLMLLALLIGTGDALFNAAAGSYLPGIAGEHQLIRANSLVEASDAGATLTGPAIGGWMIQRLGPVAPFAVNAVIFALSAAMLSRLPAKMPLSEPDSSLTAGARLLWRDREQRALLSGTLYLHLLSSAALLPFLARARDELHFAPGTIGLIVSAAGVGDLASSLLLSRVIEIRRWPLLLAIVLGVNSAAVALTSYFHSPWALAATIVVLDAASASGFIITGATRQQITADAVRGRVIAAGTALTALVRLIAVASVGVLADELGTAKVLVGLAALAVPFLLALLLLGRSALPPPEI